MDEATDALDLRLPAEARVWWGSNNGTATGRPSKMLATGWDYISLHRAITFTEEMRAAYRGRQLPSGEPEWPPSWLVLTYSGRQILSLDCSDPAAGTVTVHHHDMEDVAETHRPVVPSLGTAVEWWVDALEAGAASYAAPEGRWRYDESKLPPERKDRGIV